MMTGEEEQARGITIKSTGVSLHYELKETIAEEDGTKKEVRSPFTINLIDSPGHVDFSSEVTAALRVTDGALVVVDYIEGVCVQTETVLRQALAERIVPTLMVNKVDRGILELKVSGEEMYQRFLRVIESVNVVIGTYEGEDVSLQVDPTKGNVAFGSGYFGWAFTLKTFGEIYQTKFNIDKKILMKKLWGDNFYDAKRKKWVTTDVDEEGNRLKRGFVEFIMQPIIKLMRSIMDEKLESVFEMTKVLDIKLKDSEKELRGKDLVRNIFMKWLNAGNTILEMIVT
jgi:elongation factor 2